MATTLRSITTAAALAAIIGGCAFVSPSYADNAPAPAATSTTPAVHKHHHHKTENMADRVEDRIKALHEKLKITADQEEAWGKVADAMRDNEKSIKALIDERHQNAGTASAIDDLKSYQQIAKAHAEGLENVIDAFQPLYDSLSEDQKKNADSVFGTFEGHRGHDAK